MYDIVLFIHVLAGIGVFVALALEGLLVARLRRAQDETGLRESLSGFSMLARVGAPSVIVVLVSGVYLAAAASSWQAGWPVASLIALILLALCGIAFGSRPVQEAERLLRQEGQLPARLRDALRAARLSRSVWARVWLATGIVYLMTMKPHLAASLAVVGIAALAALATIVTPRSTLE